MNAAIASCLAFSYLVLYLLAVLALKPITLTVSRRQSFAPMTTTAEIRIPRHAENREACVVLSGPVEDLSCWELSVDSSPLFHRRWSDLQAGRYIAQARLLRGRDTWFSNTVELYVAGEGE